MGSPILVITAIFTYMYTGYSSSVYATSYVIRPVHTDTEKKTEPQYPRVNIIINNHAFLESFQLPSNAFIYSTLYRATCSWQRLFKYIEIVWIVFTLYIKGWLCLDHVIDWNLLLCTLRARTTGTDVRPPIYWSIFRKNWQFLLSDILIDNYGIYVVLVFLIRHTQRYVFKQYNATFDGS